MKKLLFTLVALVATNAGAQTFFPMKQGAVLEYEYRDGKGHPMRDKWRNGRWLRMTVEQTWGDTLLLG